MRPTTVLATLPFLVAATEFGRDGSTQEILSDAQKQQYSLFNLTTHVTAGDTKFSGRQITTLGFTVASTAFPYTPPAHCATESWFYLNDTALYDFSGNWWGLKKPGQDNSDQSFGKERYGLVREIEPDAEEGFHIIKAKQEDEWKLVVVYHGEQDFETFTLCGLPQEKEGSFCGKLSMTDLLGWRSSETERIEERCADVELVVDFIGVNFTTED
ncbi:hypothetical protein EV356DRAFT_536028 [Viridothelium virens]|uniref:Uncharacterized protein n=1 Tax=Viridothelium virens TaxID=1048519 RepID=A0A6A6GZ08_VIRVR|nr:hypothetical protein EV356DRAFT_536028 [Viridothelium virens]